MKAALATALLAFVSTLAAQPPDIQTYLQQLDSDQDGRVSQTEYVAHMMIGFDRLDRNGDNQLDASEVPRSHHQRLPVTRSDYRRNLIAVFRALDRDRDGYLSASELAKPPPR